MTRVKRGSSELGEVARSATPHRRAERRKLLREFEQEYRGRNKSPIIEL